jgi:hypothetical protein
MRDQAIGEELGEEPLDVGADLTGGDVMVPGGEYRDHFLHRASRRRQELPDASADDPDAEVHLGLGREQHATLGQSAEDRARRRER